MNSTESIAALSAALVSARAEIKNPALDRTGYGYKYASLPAILDHVIPVLAKHRLMIIQYVESNDRNVVLSTRLIHESGEWLESSFALPPARLSGPSGENPIQCMGAAITYARRYAITAMLAICGDDDNDAHGYVGNDHQGNDSGIPASKDRKEHQSSAMPRADVDDWRSVVIHFGKNKGKTLGDLPTKSLNWYACEWSPKPYRGEYSDDDIRLRAALDKYQQERGADDGDSTEQNSGKYADDDFTVPESDDDGIIDEIPF